VLKTKYVDYFESFVKRHRERLLMIDKTRAFELSSRRYAVT